MGILADIFDFLSSFDEGSYIEDAKAWGDKVWNNSSNKKSGTLSLYLVNDRLYKRMRIILYDGNIANITNEDDKGWSYSEKKLTRSQRRQLSEEGIVEIKGMKNEVSFIYTKLRQYGKTCKPNTSPVCKFFSFPVIARLLFPTL